MSKKKTGTREWSESSLNIAIGCKNNCRYCYASHTLPIAFGLVSSMDSIGESTFSALQTNRWKSMSIRLKNLLPMKP